METQRFEIAFKGVCARWSSPTGPKACGWPDHRRKPCTIFLLNRHNIKLPSQFLSWYSSINIALNTPQLSSTVVDSRSKLQHGLGRGSLSQPCLRSYWQLVTAREERVRLQDLGPKKLLALQVDGPTPTCIQAVLTGTSGKVLKGEHMKLDRKVVRYWGNWWRWLEIRLFLNACMNIK